MEGNLADNSLTTGGNIKSGPNEQNITSTAETTNHNQDPDSIPIRKNIHIGALNAYEATQFWRYPIPHQIHPNSPAAWATTTTHVGEDSITANPDSSHIPGTENIQIGVQYLPSIAPATSQCPTLTHSTPWWLIPAQVTGTATVPPSIPQSIPGQFVPGQAAGVDQKTSERPVRVKCSFCEELGHRETTCPSLPCKHCAIMGHVGKNCPSKIRNWAEGEVKCSFCKGFGHRRDMCPSRPCKYCAVMGHVGKDCLVIARKRAERKRKAKAWREAC